MKHRMSEKGNAAARTFRRYAVPFILLAAFLSSTLWIMTLFVPTITPTETPNAVILRIMPEFNIMSTKSVSIWPAGTVFARGQAAYFYEVLPVVDVMPVIELVGADVGLSGTMQILLHLRAVTNQGAELWKTEIKRLGPEAFEFSGEEERVKGERFVLRFPQLYETAVAFSEELGVSRADHQAIVETVVHVEGDVEGSIIDRTYRSELSFYLADNSFSTSNADEIGIEDIIAGVTSGETTDEISEVEASASQLWFRIPISLGFLLLFLISIKLTRKGSALEHRRYKEWITEGRVQTPDQPAIEVFSLAGLVELAIDLEKRVIFDREEGKYYLLEDTLFYVYNPEHGDDIDREKKSRLGNLLIKNGLIKPEQLEIGLMYQQRSGVKLGESLISLGFIDEISLYSTLAAQANVPFLYLDSMGCEGFDSELLNKLTPVRALVLEAVPLGPGIDGKLVVACGEPTRKGLREALEDLFDTQIAIVATVPSAIYRIIDAWESELRRTEPKGTAAEGGKTFAGLRITPEEVQKFTSEYRKGVFDIELFLKEAGYVRPAVLKKEPEKTFLQWYVSKDNIDRESAHLLRALKAVCEQMDEAKRKDLMLPTMMDILRKANYITDELAADLYARGFHGDETPDRIIMEEKIASAATTQKIRYFLSVLTTLLHEAGREN